MNKGNYVKTTPNNRLALAARAMDAAQEACYHWDYESDGDGGHQCCDELARAKHELKLARRAVELAK